MEIPSGGSVAAFFTKIFVCKFTANKQTKLLKSLLIYACMEEISVGNDNNFRLKKR